jgi:hypothetical protein
LHIAEVTGSSPSTEVSGQVLTVSHQIANLQIARNMRQWTATAIGNEMVAAGGPRYVTAHLGATIEEYNFQSYPFCGYLIARIDHHEAVIEVPEIGTSRNLNKEGVAWTLGGLVTAAVDPIEGRIDAGYAVRIHSRQPSGRGRRAMAELGFRMQPGVGDIVFQATAGEVLDNTAFLGHNFRSR